MKKHIPNLFTAINLLSGWCSVYFAFQDKIGIASLLIVFAAFFDLMDGSFTFDYGVAVKEHCFACTAGSGSSCGGTLT